MYDTGAASTESIEFTREEYLEINPVIAERLRFMSREESREQLTENNVAELHLGRSQEFRLRAHREQSGLSQCQYHLTDMAKSRVRIKELNKVFRSIAPGSIDPFVARLLVLHEDLKIEVAGIKAEEGSLGEIDRDADIKYRREYFCRRAIGTWSEFADTIRLLNDNSAFQAMKKGWEAEHSRRFNKAVKFFRLYERFCKDVRNDVGGHFGLNAARYAVSHATGGLAKIELKSSQIGARLIASFAGEITSTASFRHLKRIPSGSKSANYRHLICVLVVGWHHAVSVAQLLVVEYLWERFK